MAQKVAFQLLLLFIFATIFSTVSTSRILKESYDEISDNGFQAQDATDIAVDDADFSIGEGSAARRMDLMLDYAPTRANGAHNPKP